MEYSELISDCRCIEDIINCCHYAIPEEYKAKPWKLPELGHGINLLTSDDALNCYMSAYGEMHMIKCRAAMMNFPFDQLQGKIEIVDWGCGQGIGACTVVEILKQRDFAPFIKKITLVEPSEQAISRAYSNIRKLTDDAVVIDTRNQYLPTCGTKDNTLNGLGYSYGNVIHIFSNILDIQAIDLGAVAHMVASLHGKHYVLCMGVKNRLSYRIEKFCSVFQNESYFSKIDDASYAQTKTGHKFTCVTRGFIYNRKPINLQILETIEEDNMEMYNDYDPRLHYQNGVLSLEKARVAWRLESILSVDESIYTKTVIGKSIIDFIIIRPGTGILLINVIEDHLDNFKASDNTAKNNISKHLDPLKYIKSCKDDIHGVLLEELLTNNILDINNIDIIKTMVIFTKHTTKEAKKIMNLKGSDTESVLLYGNEFITSPVFVRNLYTKIRFNESNDIFNDTAKRKLVRMISPSWHSFKEGRIGTEPIGVQKKLSESHKIQQKISGVAGSGKTQVLIYRAVNAMKRTGGDVLILTFNITLVNYIKFRLNEIRDDFPFNKIDIYHYHHFFRIRATECQLDVQMNSYNNEDFFSKSSKHKKYHAIFIDEVQDYDTKWLHIIKNNFLIEPNGELVVFGDPKQNIYNREVDVNGDIKLGIIGGQWNSQLTTNLRFANPRLANLATSFQMEFMHKLPTDVIRNKAIRNTFNFNNIEYIDLRDKKSIPVLIDTILNITCKKDLKEFAIIANYVDLLQDIDLYYRQKTNEKTETSFITKETHDLVYESYNNEDTADFKREIMIYNLNRMKKQLFTTDKHCIKLSTIHSFKGWESPSIIFILDEKSNIIKPEIVYTAITRAKESLYIINIGDNYYHKFFHNQSL